nr:unnamed protein product [Digitaria exilis]
MTTRRNHRPRARAKENDSSPRKPSQTQRKSVVNPSKTLSPPTTRNVEKGVSLLPVPRNPQPHPPSIPRRDRQNARRTGGPAGRARMGVGRKWRRGCSPLTLAAAVAAAAETRVLACASCSVRSLARGSGFDGASGAAGCFWLGVLALGVPRRVPAVVTAADRERGGDGWSGAGRGGAGRSQRKQSSE